MKIIRKVVLIILLVLFFMTDFQVIGQHNHKEHDEHSIQKAESVLRIFDQKFKRIILAEIPDKKESELYSSYITEQWARDRKLVFGKVLHGEIDESDVELYVEGNLKRIYKNLYIEFLSKKEELQKKAREVMLPEAAGDPCNNVDFEAGTTTG